MGSCEGRLGLPESCGAHTMDPRRLGMGVGFVSQLFWETPFLAYYISEEGMRSQLPSRWHITQGQLGFQVRTLER